MLRFQLDGDELRERNGEAPRRMRDEPARQITTSMLHVRLLALPVLLASCATPRITEPPIGAPLEARFAPLSDQETWGHFTRDTPPLPVWARTLADSLPGTTALQLDLDALHRTRNPLGPLLGGRLRWVVADANRCTYAKESAESDLAKAGLTAEQIQQLDATEMLPKPERAAVEFARKLTVDAASISDKEVAGLIEAYGPDDVVAIVHTVAHANFQDRVFLALGLTVEPNGPCPPREVRLAGDTNLSVPDRPVRKEPSLSGGDADGSQVPWEECNLDQLRAQLEHQQARAPRIPRPDQVRLARLPRPNRERVAGTEWGKVSMGYQPVLTTAWFQTMGSFESEAQLDEVLANTIFWVVTRTNRCFY